MHASPLHELADLPLVRRAQSGDVEAFETLYRSSVGRIYGLCLRMTGEATVAEELTQEAFVRAWQKLSSFRAESSFTTWLFRLAVNVVLSYRRGKGRLRGREISGEDARLPEHPAPRTTPDEAVDLERAVAGLPDGARAVFVLHDVEGYRHEEIARMAGIAVGTSKAQLHRARRLMREVLG